MKRYVLILIDLIAFSTHAQKHLIGMQGGLNVSDATGMDFPAQEARRGIMAGISYEYQIKKHFSIGTDLKYEQRGYTAKLTFINSSGQITDKNLKSKFNFNYISLPIKASFKFGNTVYGFVNGGIVPAIVTDAKLIYHEKIDNNAPINYTKRIKPFDLGLLLEIGMGYKIKERYLIFAQLGYQNSVTNSSSEKFFASSTMYHYGLNGSFGFKFMLKSKSE